MTIRELIKELEKYENHDSEVVLDLATRTGNLNQCTSFIDRKGYEVIILTNELPDKEPPRPKKKYIVVGGSYQNSGEMPFHYLNAWELCRLYKVDPKVCHLLEERAPDTKIQLISLRKLKLPILRPNSDGKYSKPK